MMPALLLAALIFTPSGGDELGRVDAYADQALGYAARAGLPAISQSEGAFEVRVWRSIALLDLVTAWVITETGIRIYSNRRVVRGVIHAGDAMRLVVTKRTKRASVLLEAFETFADLNAQHIACPVKDGIGLLVEVRRGDSHFVFSAGNPDRCEMPRARQIWRTFKELLRAADYVP